MRRRSSSAVALYLAPMRRAKISAVLLQPNPGHLSLGCESLNIFLVFNSSKHIPHVQ